MKPQVLIINPWIHDFAAYDLWTKPLGALKIASALKSLNYDIYFIDCRNRYSQAEKKQEPRQLYGTGHYQKQKIASPPQG
ncbi:MAG: hypothetical protein ABH952_00295 [Candidatus Omnitrophota bacterium]